MTHRDHPPALPPTADEWLAQQRLARDLFHAPERLLALSTAQALASVDERHARLGLELAAMAPNSRRALLADWRLFCAFLHEPARHWFPDPAQRYRLPVDPQVLARFVVYVGPPDLAPTTDTTAPRAPRSRALATVRRYLASVAKIHRVLEWPDPTQDIRVRSVLKQFARGRGAQRQAAPIRWAHILALFDLLPDNLPGLRAKALLGVGHNSMARRAELVALDLADVEFHDTGHATVLIRHGKTDQAGRGRVAYLGPDATRGLRLWLDASLLTEGPLFVQLQRNGQARLRAPGGGFAPRGKRLGPAQINPIYKQAMLLLGLFEGRLRRRRDWSAAIWQQRKRAFVAGYSGHSTRIGAAQDLAAANVSLVNIMTAGGWRDPTMPAHYSRAQAAEQGGMARFLATYDRSYR